VTTGIYLERLKEMVDEALESFMPPADSHPERLVSAMRYSLFAGGKRIRPILVVAAAEAAGGNAEMALAPACAVEMVHTYSLIHDDLPAMDDDDFRRGRPTCHRTFDEGTAVLAGDALLTLAFKVLADAVNQIPEKGIRMVKELAEAGGWRGMIGGQQVDLDSEGSVPDLPVLEYIHTHKTGALIRCSVIIGGLSADADEPFLHAVGRYGEKLGLAFQIVDDILDVTATTGEMGKDQGSDAAKGKVTYPAVFGVKEARIRALKLIEDAKSHIADLDATGRLVQIADYVLLRRL
jgi:geranylgeranyl diphosphate synthase type II